LFRLHDQCVDALLVIAARAPPAALGSGVEIGELMRSFRCHG